jgi:hypothetical protein
MTERRRTATASQPPAPRPWYREPWPWVVIAIPALTVVACAVTLWLALSRPDTVVVDPDRYQQIRAGLRAQPDSESVEPAGPGAPADGDGDR